MHFSCLLVVLVTLSVSKKEKKSFINFKDHYIVHTLLAYITSTEVKGNKGTLKMRSALKFDFNNVKEPKKRKKLINIIYNRLLHTPLALPK